MVGTIPTYMIGNPQPRQARAPSIRISPIRADPRQAWAAAGRHGQGPGRGYDEGHRPAASRHDEQDPPKTRRSPANTRFRRRGDGEKLDFDKVNVGYDDPNQQKQEVYYVQKSAQLRSHQGRRLVLRQRGSAEDQADEDPPLPDHLQHGDGEVSGTRINVTVGCATHRVPA